MMDGNYGGGFYDAEGSDRDAEEKGCAGGEMKCPKCGSNNPHRKWLSDYPKQFAYCCLECDQPYWIPEQQSEIEALKAEIKSAMEVLKPNMPESGLRDACCQVKQAAILWRDNYKDLERERKALKKELSTLQERLRDTLHILKGIHEDYKETAEETPEEHNILLHVNIIQLIDMLEEHFQKHAAKEPGRVNP